MLKNLTIPVVCLFQDSRDPQLPCVVLDDFRFVHQATSYLISRGHKKIAYIGGPEVNRSNGRDRRLGFQKSMEESALSIPAMWVREGDWTVESGYRQMSELMKYEGFTAVMVANEGMAIGAINCAYDMGYEIPKDFSIMGADDTGLARASRPTLSTITLPYRKMGYQAAKQILRFNENGKTDINKIVMNYEMVIRNSTN